jgi:hypothetical protein
MIRRQTVRGPVTPLLVFVPKALTPTCAFALNLLSSDFIYSALDLTLYIRNRVACVWVVVKEQSQ